MTLGGCRKAPIYRSTGPSDLSSTASSGTGPMRCSIFYLWNMCFTLLQKEDDPRRLSESAHLPFDRSFRSELYRLIRDGTDEMFDILSLEYVFYAPPKRG